MQARLRHLRSGLPLQVTSPWLGAAGAAVIGGSIIIGAGIIAAGGAACDPIATALVVQVAPVAASLRGSKGTAKR